MKSIRAYVPHLTLAVFSLFSLQPLFRREMLCSDDGIFHIYKAVGLEALIRRGYLFPRWSPEMAHGFGYPLYNFYAPLGSYLLVALHSLGFIYPVALHVALGLSSLLSGLAMFALVRKWWGDAAGLVAGVAYMSAPYLAFDVLFRGALAESLAWVWPPLVLWGLDRGFEYDSKFLTPNPYRLLASLAYAALTLTHNVTSLIISPLFVGYVLLLAWQKRDWRAVAYGAGALAVGLALSAYFWMPALAERSLVQTDRLLVPPIFTYYTNFITPGELLAPPRAIDPLLINPSPAKTLGLVPALIAMSGLLSVALPRIRASGETTKIAFFGGGLFLYALLTLAPSQSVWDHLPLLPFVQFPWRMLMPAALCGSTLAGAVVWGVPRAIRPTPHAPRLTFLIAFGLLSLVVVANLSWWSPRYCAPFVEENVARLLDYEHATATIGTSAKAEFLPRGASLPDDDSVAEAVRRGEQPDRLRGLPEGASVEYLSNDPLNLRFRIRTPEAFDLTYLQFDYAGWSARVDGQPVPITPTPDHGLILFQVSAGSHEISIRFGPTPLRAVASGISLAALFGFVVLLVASRRRLTVQPSAIAHSQPASAIRHSPFAILTPHFALPLVPLLLFTLKVTWIDRTTNPLRHSAFDGAAINLGTPLNLSLAGGLDLLSYQTHPISNPTRALRSLQSPISSIPSGSEFDAVLYLAPRPAGAAGEFRPKFTLVSANGAVWNAPNDALPPRWHREPPPSYAWPAGQYAQWARRETVLPGTPPGRYRLVGTIFDLQSLIPDSILDFDGSPLAPDIDLGEVVVARPDYPADPAALDIQYVTDKSLGHGLTLLGYNLDREETFPGDTVLITLFWRAEETPGRDITGQLSLERSDGTTALLITVPPVTDNFPTSRWRAGDVWRGQHFVRLPADLPDGRYRWQIAIDDGERLEIGRLEITAPERTFTVPAFEIASGARFGDFADLAGYTLAPITTYHLPLALFWHALATPDAAYSAFVHLADASGRIWAQSDAIPANWERPTTGWLAGEYIADARQIALPAGLPPGEYTLYVGLADVKSGQRAVTSGNGASGDGRAAIGTVIIQP